MKIAPVFKALVLVALATSLTIGDADAQSRRSQKEKEQVDYPNAERESPKPSSNSRVARDLTKLFDLYNEGDDAAATIAQAEKILADNRAKDYDRAMANMLAGSTAVNEGDLETAIPYLDAALKSDVLTNNNHFGVMKTLASVYAQLDMVDESVAMVDRLMKETRAETAEMFGLKGGILYNAERYEEAVVALNRAVELSTPEAPAEKNWLEMLTTAYGLLGRDGDALALAEQLHQKSPDDKVALISLALRYAEAEMHDKAIALLESARSRGMLTEKRDYQALYSTYLGMDGGELKAAAAIQEGLDKGILPEEKDSYLYMGQAYYYADATEDAEKTRLLGLAIDAYRKAGDLDTTGSTDLTLTQILSNEDGREEETIKYGQRALSKGLKNPGQAWMAIGRAYYYSDQLEKAKQAYREAAKDPSTRDEAMKTLSQISR